MSWHDSWDKMRQRPHILVVCPQAVAPAWGKVVAASNGMKPWAHQTAAADWLRQRTAGMLGMDMGTGKTLTCLLALDAMRLPLVFVDLSSGTTKSRANKLQAALATASGKCLVVVVNYESVWRAQLSPTIEGVKWSAIVLDESHRVKAPGGTASKYLAKLGAKQPQAKRVCLTGTPMPHSPLDLYGQFRFLDCSVFGTSFAAMRAKYANCHPQFPGMVLSWKRQEELTAKLDAHCWRVKADDVLDLPDAIHETIEVELTTKTKRFYDRLEDDMTAELEAGTVTANNALTKILRMQQATSGYARIDGTTTVTAIDGTPAKRMALQDRLEDLASTEPVVVFCRFRSDLDDVAAAAKALGREYAEVSGARKELARWQAGDAAILGVQIQSGGLGIDCTRACYAFYYSLTHSLGDYDQSLARLRRPGQKNCVRYYHLVCKGTIDEEIYAALRARRDVVESVMAKLSTRAMA